MSKTITFTEDYKEEEDDGNAETVWCCVNDCWANTDQRYDKYGAIIQHLETKQTFCVPHAMDAIRSKTIPNWNFCEYGVDEDNEPEDYDCLAGNPRCVKCKIWICMDALDKWLEKPELPPYCNNCYVSPIKVKIKIKRKH
jgi:hypothetical protein